MRGWRFRLLQTFIYTETMEIDPLKTFENDIGWYRMSIAYLMSSKSENAIHLIRG